jgi:hypothetical protein
MMYSRELSYSHVDLLANFVHTDSIISDQGPDLTSNLMCILTEWMQTRHQFSITDMHTNGVERILKEMQRHLRAMVYYEWIKDIFADKTMLPAIQFLLNDEVSSQTGYRPFELTFGSTDSNYTKIPTGELKDSKVKDKSFSLPAYLVYAYGSNKVLDSSKIVLLREKHIQLYP